MKAIKPKQDYVLVKIVKKNEESLAKTKGGILLPGNEATKSTAGFSHTNYRFVVDDIGPKVVDIQKGDCVIFSDTYANAIKDDNDDMFVLLKEQYVFATYED